MVQYILANKIKTILDRFIVIAKNGNAQFGHIRISFLILVLMITQMVLNSIDFNHDFSRMYVKIRYIVTDHFLSVNRHGK